MLQIDKPTLLGRKNVTSEYACISRYPRHIKTGNKNFSEMLNAGSIIILKMVNVPFYLWKYNHSVILFRCYYHIKIGHDFIFWMDDGRNDDDQEKVTKDI